MVFSGFLQRIPLFRHTPQDEIDTICHVFQEREYKKNQVIFVEEDAGKFVYIVKFGELKVIQTSPDGRENILAIHHAGDTFGEMSMIDGKATPATVIAKEDCRIVTISKQHFDLVLMKNPRVVLALLQILCGRLRESWKTIQVLKYNEAGMRIKQLLLNFSTTDGVSRPDGILINVKITHQEISEMVGVSRETVSRSVSKLQRMKVLTMEQHRFVLLNHPFWREL